MRLGAGLVLGSGAARLSISLSDGATVADLVDNLRAQYPVALLDTAIAVVGGEHVSNSAPLSDGQEIALLLPIAGG